MASEVERLRVANLEVEQLRASLLATHGGVEPSGLLDELLTAVRAELRARITAAINDAMPPAPFPQGRIVNVTLDQERVIWQRRGMIDARRIAGEAGDGE